MMRYQKITRISFSLLINEDFIEITGHFLFSQLTKDFLG